MKRAGKITLAMGIVASLGLGMAAVSVHAHPGEGGMMGGMHQGMMGGMQQGMMEKHQAMMGGNSHGAMGHGSMGQGAGIGAQLMTPEEQTAMREKMRAAKTPEERQKLAEANRSEMQKRAKEKGITLPEAHAGHGEHGQHGGPATPPAAK
jgi:hypothetical protein